MNLFFVSVLLFCIQVQFASLTMNVRHLNLVTGMQDVQLMPLDGIVVAVQEVGLERIVVVTLTTAWPVIFHHVTMVVHVSIHLGPFIVSVPQATQVMLICRTIIYTCTVETLI